MPMQKRGRSTMRKALSKKRSIFVKSTPSRAKSTPVKVRTSKAPRKAAAPKTQGSQMGYKSSTLSLAKPMSKGAMTAALTRSMLESVVLRWNGVKSFDTRGNYWMSNLVTAGVRALPWYMMDLTAVNNWGTVAGVPDSQILSYPLLQMKQTAATGAIFFSTASGYDATGLGPAFTYRVEKAPSGPSAVGEKLNAPFCRSMIQNASIQANLWGCKSKATKYMVQVVRITDEDLVPDHNLAQAGTEVTLATSKRNDFYQSMIKTWTFNPISTTGGIQSRKYKVLKTQTITIEPNPTTDGDADPQVVVYKAFLKLNKICKYEETSAFLATDVATNDDSDYAVNNGNQITSQVDPKARIYLVIRATNYGIDTATGDLNTVTPSFDLSVRIRHTIPK